jgi:translation initiation factor IF-1
MVKNAGGNRAKKQASKRSGKGAFSSRAKTTRLARAEGEIYAAVEKMAGGGFCNVTTYDGRELLCVIRNKFRGRGKRDNLIVPGVWILIGLYDWEKPRIGSNKKMCRPKCDLLEVYSDSDKEFLKENDRTDFSKLVLIGVVNQANEVIGSEIEFVNDDTRTYETITESNDTETVSFEKESDVSKLSIEDIIDDI